MGNNFFVEIEFGEAKTTISLDTDKATIYLYQKCDGEQRRILEIECSAGADGNISTEVDRVNEDDLGFDQLNSENGMTVTSRK